MAHKRRRKERDNVRLGRSPIPAHVSRPSDVHDLQHAQRLHQQGAWAEAKDAYCAILARDRTDGFTWHLLGMLLHQVGESDSAIECLSKAIDYAPDNIHILNNFGVVCLAQRRLDEAHVLFTAALAQPGCHADVYNNLGVVQLELHELPAAEASFRQALKLDPAHINAVMNLGNALQQQGRFWEAIACHRQVLARDERHAVVWNNLGSCLLSARDPAEALPAFRQAVSLAPNLAEAAINLGRTLIELRQLDEGLAYLTEVVARFPGNPHAQRHLGQAWELNEAFDRACACYDRALAIDPHYAFAYAARGNAKLRRGDMSGAIEDARRAIALRPDLDIAHSCLLFLLTSSPDATPEQLYDAHRAWGEQCERGKAIMRRRQGNRSVTRPLRIGYVSPDFRQHAVAAFLAPIMRNHDATRVSIYCYANLYAEDRATNDFRQWASEWRSVWGYADEQLAQMIADDDIDVLVDLAGHTTGNRLGAFAFRPAPVQVTWLGYPNTTGLTSIDYYLTNSIQDPPEENHFRTERPWYLPIDTCYAPPEYAPDVASPPCAHGAPITLGSLHRPNKLTRDVLRLWADCLHAIPDARLRLFHTSFRAESQSFVIDTLSEFGIDASRVAIGRTIGSTGYLTEYHQIDIALDIFPWAGGTTTREALWMGVPVVGLYGDRRSARSTAAVLHQVGLSSLVATSSSEYVECVARSSRDVAQLVPLRQSMRERIRSTIGNAPQITRDVEDAFFAMDQRQREASPTSDPRVYPPQIDVTRGACHAAAAAPISR